MKMNSLFAKKTNVENLREEMKRRNNNRQSMLRMFQKRGELTTKELIQHFGTGCSSRLFELRKNGHKIVTTMERPGLYRYTYLGETNEE